MRMARMAAKAVVGMVLIPGLALAQASGSAGSAGSANKFNDSWFWGINGGAMFLTAGFDQSTKVTAPSVGGEWLITRTHIGLRIAVDQSFFDEQTGIGDPSAPGGVRQVAVKDWRRYAGEMYFFTSTTSSLRPYAGLGLALNVLQNSAPTGTYNSQGSMDSTFTAVNEFSSKVSAVFTAGGQYSLGRSALFLQGSAMPTKNNFLMNRSSYTFMVQGGLRYNVGSAIEKM